MMTMPDEVQTVQGACGFLFGLLKDVDVAVEGSHNQGHSPSQASGVGLRTTQHMVALTG